MINSLRALNLDEHQADDSNNYEHQILLAEKLLDVELGNSKLNFLLETLLLLPALVLLMYWNRVRELNGYQWYGTGTVQMTSMGSDQGGKVTATIRAQESAFAFSKGYIDYWIHDATWPDGHKVSFGANSCDVRSTAKSATCNDSLDHGWELQILAPPSKKTSHPLVDPVNTL